MGESYEPEFRFAVERVFAVYVAPDDTLAPEALIYLPILSTVRSADHRELVVTAVRCHGCFRRGEEWRPQHS